MLAKLRTMKGKHLAKKEKSQNQRKTSNVILLILGIFLLSFVICMIVTFWRFQSVPDTLIDKVLDGSSIEVLVLALIKISKVISQAIKPDKNKEEPK